MNPPFPTSTELPSSAPVLYRLSPHTVLRLNGPDRLRFLNGQVTQDVSLATRMIGVPACVLNAKGQLEAFCHIREEGDSYLIDAPIELRDDLFARLDRYLIADDALLTDESDDWHVAHLTCGTEETLASLPAGTQGWKTARLHSCDPGQAGIDLFSREPVVMEGLKMATPAEFRLAATEAGLPQWGSELTTGLFPPEAGLDRYAISYAKGCYLGQEVISRMRTSGRTNRHLVSLATPPETLPGAILLHEDEEAGVVTSVASRSGEQPGEVTALGFRRRKFTGKSQFSVRNPSGVALPGKALVRTP